LPVASFIADYFRNRTTSFKYVSESKYSEDSRIISSSYNSKSWREFILKASCDLGPLLLDNKIDDINLNVSIDDKPASPKEISRFRDELLQASRRKFTKPEYIACPGCGRTLFNLEEVFEEVKRRTSHLKGYNIAVMGCVVNGPGEMADADYGYVGEGRNKVSIYRGKTAIFRAVPQDEAIDKLLELIEEDRRSNLFKPRN
jgi:(E)-4-hydroxy-3-methylbut-2-enyl-diphosphate synthase